jgi:hypothetical protein
VTELKIPGIERPATRPEYGAKTAQAILDIVRLNPEFHDQHEWYEEVNPNAPHCGTTMCVAGWAGWIHEGVVPDDDETKLEDRAAEYLGLDWGEADRLFYTMSEDAAVRALEYVARGEKINWLAVRGY